MNKTITMMTLAIALMPVATEAAQQQKTITADGTYCLSRISNPPAWATYRATAAVDGDFGGGTISWFSSYDGGTTSQAIVDMVGTAETSTADDQVPIELGNNPKQQPLVCAVLAGATNPSILFRLIDNN